MNKEKEEMLEKLRNVKQTSESYLKENNFENYVVKNVIHYNKKVQLVNKETNKKEEFDLYAVIAENTNSEKDGEKIFELEYLANKKGKIFTISDLIKEYEGFENIKDVVDKTKKNEEKPEKEQDKNLEIDDLKELEAEKKQEEKDKTKNTEKKQDEKDPKVPKFKTDKSGATSLDQMIDGVTLRNILKLDSNYECIKPVNASQVKGFTEKISNKDAVIAIKKNGECTILDDSVIRPDRQEGNNSFDRDLNIENDGNVKYKSNTSSYQIANRPNYYISIGYDEESSKKEIKISKRSGREGDREVEFELQKYGDSAYVDSDARKLRQENEDGIEKSEKIVDKQRQHEEVGCENDRVENIDNYEDNNIHEHIEITKDSIVPGKDITIEEWSEELGENTDVIIDRFKREIEKNPKEELGKLADEIEEDYEIVNREHKH